MIAIACDHSALDMKRNIEELLDEMGLEIYGFRHQTAPRAAIIRYLLSGRPTRSSQENATKGF